MAKEVTQPPQLLRGMKDIQPADWPYWHRVFDAVRDLAGVYGFERVETPILEASSLFNRSIGQDTEIMEKQMYSFVDKSGDSVSLRPEGTASVVRSYIEHGMLNLPQPVKLYYLGPFFRHERPQAGRYRQLWQFGLEVIGTDQPVTEVQLILLARAVYQVCGLDSRVQINSLGDKASRTAYIKALQAFFRTRKSELTEEQREVLLKTPLRLLDSKDPKILELLTDAPQIVDHLDDASRQHFVKVLEYLDELEVPYVLNPRLVRGLDYYNRTVFEIWSVDDELGQSALGGGGRYDGLVEQLGGRPTPAAGFAGGIERLVNKMKESGVVPPVWHPEVFLAQLGEPARKKMLKLFEALRSEGIRASESMTKDGLKPQLEMANKLGVPYTLIIGQKELMDDTILIRDMENGIQEIVPYDKAVAEVKKRVSRVQANSIRPVIGQIKPDRVDLTDKLEDLPLLAKDHDPDIDNE